jgi:Tol biopolymer transport system component
VLAGVASFAAGTAWLDTSEPLPLMRFGFAPASRSLPEIPSVAMASDGARLAYTTLDRLWVRGLAEAEPVVVTGPTGWIGTPAFSPSGSAIAYVNAPTANGPFSIMRVPVGGGTPATIHIGISSLPTDLDWDARERVTYVQPDGIWEVPAAGGGDARLVIAAEEGETLASPQRLPDGESMLFTSTKAQGRDRWNEATVFVATPQSTGAERRVVREHASDARYVPSGHVIFADGSTLWAAPFSPDSAAMGERFRIVDQVLRAPSGASDTAHYAVSANGALVHLGVGAEDPAATAAGGGGFVMLGAPQQFSLVWVDRMGNEEPIDVRRDRYASVRLSPDGNRAAVVIGGNPIAGEPRDIWILDLRTNDISRLTSDGQSDAPIWLDNDRIIYRTAPPPVGVFSVAVDGGEPQLLRRAPSAPTAYPMGLTPDRRTLLVLNAPNVQQQNMVTLALDGDSDYVPLLEEPGVQSFTSVSPNGKFVVYHQGPSLNETSVVVRPFPAVALRSYTVERGSHPIFSRDGSEIFYFDGETIVAVPVAYEPFDIGTPVRLGLRGPYFYGANRTWDEAPDGRFLMTRMGEPEAAQIAQGSLQIQVIVGLSGVLEQRTR